MPNNKNLDALKANLKSFLPLSDEQLEVWLEDASFRSFKKDDFILRNGEIERYLNIVINGLTRHYIINPKGEEMNFDFSFPYEYSFAFGSFINQQPTKFFIQAMTDVTLISIPREKIQALYEAYPNSNVFGRISAEQYYLWREERELALQTLTPDERYRWLLENHPKYLKEIPLKHIASFLNLTPETLSRVRKRFVRKREI